MAIQLADNQGGHSPGRQLALRGMVVVLSLGFWVYAFFGTEGLRDQQERNRHRAALEEQLSRERAENAVLQREVEALRGDDPADDRAIEEAVRVVLDYQKPGEHVLHVGDDDPLHREPRRRHAQVVLPPVPEEKLAATRRALGRSASAAPVTKKASPAPAPEPED